jgi:dUTP pyrophosphatase
MQLPIKKLHPDAKLPAFAHDTDAGMDVYTTKDIELQPGELVAIPTGIAFVIPVGHVGLIWDKSGVAIKRGLKTLGGVVDAGYRGEVFVGIVNTGTVTQSFSAGGKVAQMLIQKIEQPEIIEVDDLDDTARGDGAFGSTGK